MDPHERQSRRTWVLFTILAAGQIVTICLLVAKWMIQP